MDLTVLVCDPSSHIPRRACIITNMQMLSTLFRKHPFWKFHLPEFQAVGISEEGGPRGCVEEDVLVSSQAWDLFIGAVRQTDRSTVVALIDLFRAL